MTLHISLPCWVSAVLWQGLPKEHAQRLHPLLFFKSRARFFSLTGMKSFFFAVPSF
jgi:hypothetical protein